jgi:hypothetical protein
MDSSRADSQPGAMPAELLPAAEALTRIGRPASMIAWQMLASIGDSPESDAPVSGLKTSAGMSGDLIERLLIWQAAQEALPRVDSLPLDSSTRMRLADELCHYHAVRGSLAAGGYPFIRAAKMATLRLFPAGPLDWVVSGIPRSWILEASRETGAAACVRMLWFIAWRLRGFSPCFFLHVAPPPKNRGLVLEKETLKAYYRMARCLECQPQMRGVIGHAWFFDPNAVRDQPHLEPLNRPFVSEGGTIATLGPAPPESGVLEGNAARKEEYLAGRLQYRYGLAIWPREAALRWAKAHPELAA